MRKSVIVAVRSSTRHPLYKKIVHRLRRLMAHDEADECRMGDRVRIVEMRPMSRRKRWKVAQVLERADLPEVAAESIDLDLLGEIKPDEEQEITEVESPVAEAAAPAAAEAPADDAIAAEDAEAKVETAPAEEAPAEGPADKESAKSEDEPAAEDVEAKVETVPAEEAPAEGPADKESAKSDDEPAAEDVGAKVETAPAEEAPAEVSADKESAQSEDEAPDGRQGKAEIEGEESSN
jgi:small subunit ribosomal protein S17